jgi:hypothetical protein
LPNDFGKKLEVKSLGGLSSGSWYRLSKKTTVEECHSLDVRYLHRDGLLKPGYSFSLRWSRAGRETGSIGGVAFRDQVVLLYRHRRGLAREWEEVQEAVPLVWTPCNFGGERPWFICPRAGCGRRVAVLYGPGRYFLCRHCHDLGYQSQREDEMHEPSDVLRSKRALGRQREHDGAFPGEA